MPQPAGAATLPRRFGAYTLLEEIGTGPRGTVYRAEKDGRRLALKVFRPGVAVDRSVLERFRRASPSPIRHPNLLAIEEIADTEGLTYCSMRLLAGDALRSVLDDLRRRATDRPFLSPLSPGAGGELHPAYLSCAVALVADVAEGLERAHAEAIIHGRIGPDNLIFSPGGHLVLTDFGGAGDGCSDAPVDTRRYRAPEQLRRTAAARCTVRTDVYALGVVLRELAELRSRFALDDAVPPALAPCILRATASEPEARYASAGELAGDLRRFLRGESTFVTQPCAAASVPQAPAAPVPLAPAAAPSAPRKRRGLAVLLAVRLGAAAALVLAAVVGLRVGNRARGNEDNDTPPAGVTTSRNLPSAPSEAHALRALTSDLNDTRWAVRVDALERLSAALSSGALPRSETMLSTTSLRAQRPEERELAFSIFVLGADSSALLRALAIGEGLPECRLDRDLFARLLGALGRIADPPAEKLISRWGLEVVRHIDGLAPGESTALAPNLAVEATKSPDRPVLREWIAAASLLWPDELASKAAELAQDPELTADVVLGLRHLSSPPPLALDALEAIARRHYLAAGPAAISALADLGAQEKVAALARSDLPLELRVHALEALGECFLDSQAAREELLGALLRSPEGAMRTVGFAFLSRLDGSDGWDPQPAVRAALATPELTDPALRWFDSLAPAWQAPLALELLDDVRPRVRERAAQALAADRDPSRWVAIALRLGGASSATRRAALEALGRRADLATLLGMARSAIEIAATALWETAAAQSRGLYARAYAVIDRVVRRFAR
jgi:serine/threonine protein kinase